MTDEVIRMSDIPRRRSLNQNIRQNWEILKKNADRRPEYVTKGSPHPFFNTIEDGVWSGQRCFIVGGGSSLTNFDFSQLNDELTIGINVAFTKFNPTILFSTDSRFYSWIVNGTLGEDVKQQFDDYRGWKVWLNVANYEYPDNIFRLDCGGETAFPSTIKEGLGHGNNSGYSALNLAVCLGANPIYLLGFDMRGANGLQKWWHKLYPCNQGEQIFQRMIKNFNNVADLIKKKGIQVINLNPDSALKCFDSGELNNIPKNPLPLIISYYTENTVYKDIAKRLKSSLDNFSLKYDIQPVSDMGSWQKNTYYKAIFIRQMMDKHPDRDLLWLDADAIVWRFPEIFRGLESDIAFYSYGWRGQKYLCSGTLYIKNNDKMKSLVSAWIEENQNWINTSKFEQKVLQELLQQEKWKSTISVFDLPEKYCYIEGLMFHGRPVIEHFQASRRYKNDLKGYRDEQLQGH